MNPEYNKIAGAVLVAGVLAIGTTVLARHLFPKDHHAHDDEPKRGFAIVDPSLIGSAVPAAAAPSAPDPVQPILGLLANASVDEGIKVFRKCAACHTPDKGGANKVGPNMWDIVNNKRGHIAGFAYTDALLNKEGKWTYASLNAFLYRPKDYIPGTKMNFAGLKDAQERADLIAYLRTLSDSPAALPSADEIAAEQAALAPPAADVTPEPADVEAPAGDDVKPAEAAPAAQ